MNIQCYGLCNRTKAKYIRFSFDDEEMDMFSYVNNWEDHETRVYVVTITISDNGVKDMLEIYIEGELEEKYMGWSGTLKSVMGAAHYAWRWSGDAPLIETIFEFWDFKNNVIRQESGRCMVCGALCLCNCEGGKCD